MSDGVPRRVGRVEEYRPGTLLVALYCSTVVALTIIGFLAVFYYSLSEVSTGWPWLLAIIAIGAIGFPLIQLLALSRFGIPTSGVTWGGASPYLTYWWKVENHRFTRREFIAVYGLSAAFLCTLAVVYVALAPGALMILALVIAGQAGNLWFSAQAFRRPEGTLVEEIDGGVRFHQPA